MGKGGYGTVRRTDTLYRDVNDAAARREAIARRLRQEREVMLPRDDGASSSHVQPDNARVVAARDDGGDSATRPGGLAEAVVAAETGDDSSTTATPSSLSNADMDASAKAEDEKKIRFQEESVPPAQNEVVFVKHEGPLPEHQEAANSRHGSQDFSLLTHFQAAGDFVKAKSFKRGGSGEEEQQAAKASQQGLATDNKVSAASIQVDIESFSFFSKEYWERVNHGFKYINDPESIPLVNLRDMHNSMMAIQEIYVVAGALACGFALTLMEVVDLSEADLGLYLTFAIFATIAFLSGICAVMVAVFNFMGFAVTPSSHTELLSVSLGQFLALPGTMLFISLLTLACSVATSSFVVSYKAVRITITIICAVSFLCIILSSTYLTGQIVAIRDYCIAHPDLCPVSGTPVKGKGLGSTQSFGRGRNFGF